MGRLISCPDCGGPVSKKASACPKCGRKMGRSLIGRLFGMTIKSALLGVVLLVVLIRGLTRKPSQPAPEIAPPVEPATVAAPTCCIEPTVAAESSEPSDSDALPPGSIVEVVGDMLYRDLDVLEAHKVTGTIPNGGQSGRPVFGLMAGTHARIEATQGDAVRVQLLDGNWSGRSGWLPIDEVRPLPSAEEMAADVVDGLPLDRRREIYAALHQSGMAASREAERHFPLADLPTDESALKRAIASHKQVYEAMKKEGRIVLVKRFKVDGATLDRIESEGDARRWPLGD